MVKKQWRKRTRGSARQVGQPFMLSSSQQKLKAGLPRIRGATRRIPLSQMKVSTLSRMLREDIADKANRKELRADEAVTNPYAQELARRISNARSEKEAERIEREIHTYTKDYVRDIEGQPISSLIWDYGVDWNKVRWNIPKEKRMEWKSKPTVGMIKPIGKLARAPKTAKATEEGLTKTKRFSEQVREDISRIEQRLAPPKKQELPKKPHEPPPLPP